MGLESKAGGSESRFAAYVEAITSVLGHADRAAPFQSYYAKLLLPGDRKSVEPMAARVQPGRVQAAHQSLHHFVAKADWSDDAMLAAVRSRVQPVIERHGPIRALIVDDTGIPKKGKHSVGVARAWNSCDVGDMWIVGWFDVAAADLELPRMLPAPAPLSDRSRLAVLLEHFATIDDPRDVRRITRPLAEILLLVVCGTIADCDDYDHIAAWGEAHLEFLRRHLPYANGVPGGRWLTILMNRINPALFSAVFTAWVRGTWPDRPDFVAIDGKTSRRSHDRAAGAEPLHLVSAFATTSRLVLGQEAVPDKANELTAIPALLARPAERDGLRGALVSIDAIATSATIAKAIRDAGADYLLAVKANQPSLRTEVEACFATAPPGTLESHTTHDKGHGRIEQRTASVVREVDWLAGNRRFPGELRLPGAACIVRLQARIERGGKAHAETRYCISSANRDAERAGQAVRGHWGIENRLHWVLDVTFDDDQSRLRKGFGAKNMAVVRHFALNLVRSAKDAKSIKLRRKLAGWTPAYLEQLLNEPVR